MQRKSTRRILIISTLILILTGCSSVKMGYRFFDNAIRWKINEYVSLNHSQSVALTQGINGFHLWHQQTQLPLYASFMGRKAVQFEQATLSPQDFSKIYDEAFAIAMVSVDKLGPVITDMLLSLEDKQIPAVIKNMERESAKDLKKDFGITPKQRSLKRQNKMIQRLAKFTGGLNKTQRDLIAEWASALPIDEKILTEQQARFVEALSKLLNNRSNPEMFSRSVLAQFKTPEQFSSAAYRQSYQKRKQVTLKLMSDLFNSLTPFQKTRLIASVKQYQADFLSLAPRK